MALVVRRNRLNDIARRLEMDRACRAAAEEEDMSLDVLRVVVTARERGSD